MYKPVVDESVVLSWYTLNLSLDAPLWSDLQLRRCHGMGWWSDGDTTSGLNLDAKYAPGLQASMLNY